MRISWNRAPFAAWEHPSWRQLFDVGQWDSACHAGRPVGPPNEPFYFDQNETWRAGQYPDATLHGAVAAAKHRLLLVP
jgi:hypothetical protein